ncbi:pyruvate, water dikinase regulatory protein [Solibacillus isronensis]|uniref:pyruvate, water dikinase regulatory protein n=1 Tax=Solibacillus isronensis TaxID=412383 RepID=UPI0009A65538|nr:pyruvate, water dikinase regulatory protein [Solibacillus isronensis]
MKKLTIFVVSDSVGETGEAAVKAVVSQFRPNFEKVRIRKFPHIANVDVLEKIVQIAIANEATIVFTLVEKQMRQALQKIASEYKVHAIDLLGSMLDLIETSFDEMPLQKPGLVHQLDDDYFKKIEAIEFAVKYDDGQDPRGILLADIVLVGVSRTSKTPLSQYLAHKRYKVANVPLVPEVEPPVELMQIDPKKCFGLVITPEKLNNIRKERLITLGLTENAFYAQHTRIEQEISYFYSIVDKIGCRTIDVTNRAVEETAHKIIDMLELDCR